VNLKLAQHLVESGQEAEAMPLIDEAIEIDHALNLSKLFESAKQNAASRVIARCEEFLNATAPRMSLASEVDVIATPALMNGDFELGLSYYWGRYATDTETATWDKVGKSRTAVECISKNTKTARRCLAIRINSPPEE
jgi:hypothetical protein